LLSRNGGDDVVAALKSLVGLGGLKNDYDTSKTKI
jgi:hypothetical protein